MDPSAERTSEADNAFELPRPAGLCGTGRFGVTREIDKLPECRAVVGQKREQPGQREKPMRSR